LNAIVNILCVSSKPIYLENKEKLNLNLIVMQGDIQLAETFNLLQEIFLKQEQIDLKVQKLLDVLAHGNGMQHIIDVGSELLGNPIILVDSTFKLLYCTRNVETEDIYWNELVREGYFSNETVTFLRTHKYFELMNRDSGPVFFSRDVFGVARILWRIKVKNKVVGQLCLLESNKLLSESDIRLFAKLCDVVSCEMQKSTFIRNSKGHMYEAFISDILDGKINAKITIDERIKYLDLELKENLYVFTVNTTTLYDKENIYVTYIRDVLEQIVNGSKPIIYRDNIVIIVNRSSEISMQEHDMKNLMEFLKNNNIYCGISRCFKELVNLKEYFGQSVKALYYGMHMSKEKRVFLYEDYVICHLLDMHSENNDLSKFCHTSIFKLIEYDNINNCDNMHTLYTFLKNSKRLIETANELHIHRNTLSYRLKSIEEVMEIDFDDIDVMLHILLSFKILQFMDKADYLKKLG
jgi:sugar diacid utilization regulator